MSHSSASAGLFLPFGSLTGVVPIDAFPRGRVLGDFSSVIGCDRRGVVFHAIPWSVEPIAAVPPCRRLPTRVGDGGI